MIRFRDDRVYNQVARWVGQRRVHTIERYFTSHPEQLELAGMRDMLAEVRRAPQGQEEHDQAMECHDEGFDWLQGVQQFKTAGKVVIGVGGAYLLWRMIARMRHKR